jgi:hypothetical protein
LSQIEEERISEDIQSSLMHQLPTMESREPNTSMLNSSNLDPHPSETFLRSKSGRKLLEDLGSQNSAKEASTNIEEGSSTYNALNTQLHPDMLEPHCGLAQESNQTSQIIKWAASEPHSNHNHANFSICQRKEVLVSKGMGLDLKKILGTLKCTRTNIGKKEPLPFTKQHNELCLDRLSKKGSQNTDMRMLKIKSFGMNHKRTFSGNFHQTTSKDVLEPQSARFKNCNNKALELVPKAGSKLMVQSQVVSKITTPHPPLISKFSSSNQSSAGMILLQEQLDRKGKEAAGLAGSLERELDGLRKRNLELRLEQAKFNEVLVCKVRR